VRILAFIFLVVSLVLLPACSNGGSRVTPQDIPATDFSLEDLNHRSVALSSLRGKAVFINFWATTCPPCVSEMPNIQELHEEWSSGQEAAVLTVNNGESYSTVLNFMQSKRYTFPVLMDVQFKVAEKYLIKYLPTSLVVDSGGRIQYRVIGPFKDKAAIVKAVQGYMK
jgi:thiol-disulfide isomerase/thioredoxin